MGNFYRAPRKGQTVRLVFEGVVTDTDLHNVRLRTSSGTATVGWGAGLYPKVEVLDEGFRAGDIGVYTYDNGPKETVVYRGADPENGVMEGWYRGYAPETPRLAVPHDKHVELYLRANGDPVEN